MNVCRRKFIKLTSLTTTGMLCTMVSSPLTSYAYQCYRGILATTGGRNKSTVFDFPIKRFTFDNFAVGPGNRNACSACKKIVAKPLLKSPLVVLSNVSHGKTHLLHAIYNQVFHEHFYEPDKVCLLNLENFIMEALQSIKAKKLTSFLRRFKKLDMLLLDDIQFISGKPISQKVLCHIIDSLVTKGKQVALASTCHPEEIPDLTKRLSLILKQGWVVTIDPPDTALNFMILKGRAKYEQFALPYEVAYYVATHTRNDDNIRVLEAVLFRIYAYAALDNEPISLSLAKKVMADLPKL